MTAGETEASKQIQTERYDAAVEELRRLGAKIQATSVAASSALRTFLAKSGYDLQQAGGGLIALSNTLHTEDGSKAIHKDAIQKGLRLPRDYSDERIKAIKEAHSRGVR